MSFSLPEESTVLAVPAGAPVIDTVAIAHNASTDVPSTAHRHAVDSIVGRN